MDSLLGANGHRKLNCVNGNIKYCNKNYISIYQIIYTYEHIYLWCSNHNILICAFSCFSLLYVKLQVVSNRIFYLVVWFSLSSNQLCPAFFLRFEFTIFSFCYSFLTIIQFVCTDISMKWYLSLLSFTSKSIRFCELSSLDFMSSETGQQEQIILSF